MLVLPILAAAAVAPASRLGNGAALSRRALLGSALAARIAPEIASAADEELISVYFGCGCFWHVQHEFVEAEKTLLQRSDLSYTAHAGYAGGNKGAPNGKVCYHNAAQVDDYGGLGHAEVVGMTIPASKFGLFAQEYCKLFDDKGYRPDQLGDRGPEYRNLVGVPGGTSSPYAKALVEASIKEGDRLDFAAGKGDDGDVRGLAWIMDTDKHPFYIAEAYHQFHDGFNWCENYPNSYNDIAKKQLAAQGFKDSGCPNGMLGIGIGGL